MSKDFIQKRLNGNSIHLAATQQEQLAYFTQSEIQKEVTEDYITQWVNRKYATNDYFLNHVKTVFKTDNFLSFFKYFRNPNASAKLINTRLKEPLSRVFFSEDKYFNYTVRGNQVQHPEILNDDFEEELFESLLFRHNDVVIHDLNDFNSPYRFFLSIDKVVSIDADKKRINKIAYSASAANDSGQEVKGYAYMDSERFAFYDKDLNEIRNVPHDLGRCPAEFVIKETMGKDPIVKKAMFSYVRADLEEYVFLKTLQRMTEPNGAIPVATILKTKEKSNDGKDKQGLNNEPMSLNALESQKSQQRSTVASNGSLLQTGSVIAVPTIRKNDNSVDVDLAKNFINFFYLPVDAMEYLNTRIKEVEQNIIVSVLGDYSEANESAKNEMQVSKSYVSKEDKLRWLSNTMSRTRNESDWIMLALAYGAGSVECDTFYGSDFFLETQSELFNMLQISPNAIESTNILVRLAQSRNRFNKTKADREVILYKLLPYVTDNDFKTSVDAMQVDNITFQYQTRFTYWVAMFESNYGSITTFWDEMEAIESEKLVVINNLIENLIKSNTNINTNGKETNSTPEGVQGNRA